MSKIGVFYGSTTGTTEDVARKIAEKLNVPQGDIHDASDSYSDTFCDGIGILYEDLKDTGCTFIGITDTAGYTFDASVAVVNGKFVGLPIDEVNEDSQTDQRIDQWVEGLKKEIN